MKRSASTIATLRDRIRQPGISSNQASAQLVRSIIAMGHALDMQLIADGVEILEQRDLLASLGYEYCQGYLFSKPLPMAAFQALLVHTRASRAHSPK